MLDLATREFAALLDAAHGSRRIRVDAFELALLGLIVSMTAQSLRHGHIKPNKVLNLKSCRRVSPKLEVLRKRAKRAWLKSVHAALYPAYRKRWRSFRTLVRLYYACCDPRTKRPLQQQQKQWVQASMAIATEVLREEKMALPDEKVLRHFVRLIFRGRRRDGHMGVCAPRLLDGDHQESAIFKYLLLDKMKKAGLTSTHKAPN